jgi:hypothetical protein
MSSFRAVHAVMSGLENILKQGFPDSLSGEPVNGKVQLVSSSELKTTKSFGNTLALYLYRVIVDATGRNRWLPAPVGSGQPPQRELPLNLHFLLISWGTNAGAELDLHAWGVQQLATLGEIDLAHLGEIDPSWGERDRVQILPEELPTEDLFKIWDGLPLKYSLSSAYVAKSVRLALTVDAAAGPPVLTRVFPVATQP